METRESRRRKLAADPFYDEHVARARRAEERSKRVTALAQHVEEPRRAVQTLRSQIENAPQVVNAGKDGTDAEQPRTTVHTCRSQTENAPQVVNAVKEGTQADEPRKIVRTLRSQTKNTLQKTQHAEQPTRAVHKLRSPTDDFPQVLNAGKEGTDAEQPRTTVHTCRSHTKNSPQVVKAGKVGTEAEEPRKTVCTLRNQTKKTLQAVNAEKECTDTELVQLPPNLPLKSDAVLLEDSKSDSENPQILPNNDSSSLHDDADCDPATSSGGESKNLPLIEAGSTRRYREAKIIICYDDSSSDASEQRKIPAKSSKELSPTEPHLISPPRGTGDIRNLQQTTAMPLELETSTRQFSAREKTDPSAVGDVNIVLISDGSSEENGCAEEEAMNLNDNAKLQDSDKNDRVSPVRSRSSRRDKTKKRLMGRYYCTVCLTPLHRNEVARHPLLGVCICRVCKQNYRDTEFDKEEDGTERFCRWCGDGGQLVCCGQCDRAFCEECITKNFGEGELLRIVDPRLDWLCFVCDRTVLRPFVERLLRAREEIYRYRFDMR